MEAGMRTNDKVHGSVRHTLLILSYRDNTTLSRVKHSKHCLNIRLGEEGVTTLISLRFYHGGQLVDQEELNFLRALIHDTSCELLRARRNYGMK